MKKRNISLVAVLLIGLLSLTGCDPSSKAEASSPVVVGAKDAQAAVVSDASGLYGTVWTRGLETLTISKDGTVHLEALMGDSSRGEPYLDAEGRTCLSQEWDGFIDGGYIVWKDKKTYEYQSEEKSEGTFVLKYTGETVSHYPTHYTITFIGEKSLFFDTLTYIKKQ